MTEQIPPEDIMAEPAEDETAISVELEKLKTLEKNGSEETTLVSDDEDGNVAVEAEPAIASDGEDGDVAVEAPAETSEPEDIESSTETPEDEDTVNTDDSSVVVEKKKASLGLKILLWSLLLVIIATVAGIGWVLWTDYQATGIVPEGVTFNGMSMAGLTEIEAKTQVDKVVDGLNSRPVLASLSSVPATSTFRTGEPTAVLGDLVELDAETTVKKIVDARGQSDIITRARHDFLGEPIVRDVEIPYEIKVDAVSDFVSRLASHYKSEAADASLSQKGGVILLEKSREGFVPNLTSSEDAVKTALLNEFEKQPFASGNVEFNFVGEKLMPKTTTDSLKKIPSIVVSLSKRRVTLFNGEDKIKTYPCAIGTPSHPTPVGNWKITEKRKNPVWRNPGSAWAKDMPASIGPSATSPLGLRALNLNAKNIRLHGTSNINSIGTAASHGCVRMFNRDIVDLFDRVEVGTKVFIIR